MRICIVGGIFDKSNEYRAKHALTPESILVDALRSKGFKIDAVGHSRFRPSNDYDLVHVHHLGIASLRMAAANTKSAFIFTSHNGPVICGYERSRARKAAFRYVLKRCTVAIALSRAEAQFLKEIGVEASKINVIPNGIPSDIFHPNSPIDLQSTGPLQVIFVGQLVESKGIDVLFRALSNIAKKRNVELLLVYQTSYLESNCRQLAKKLGIEDLIRFVGFLNTADLAALYRKADLLVLPSFAEALPSVITESLLSGIPVVATRVGGIPEQVGRFGKLVQPGNVVELASAIDSVLEELPKFKALSQEMHEYASRKFNVENMINSHIELYCHAMKSKSNRQKNRRTLSMLDKPVQWLLDIYK
jgi:glycosyltransferase involved in cell wall biosynthesis